MADFQNIISTPNYDTPKALYIGVDGVARKVKKAYIGVDNVARKVKKMYLGVGGIARCIFSGGELSYYGRATDLSQARMYLASTTVGDYALFAGGRDKDGNSCDTVDVYESF